MSKVGKTSSIFLGQFGQSGNPISSAQPGVSGGAGAAVGAALNAAMASPIQPTHAHSRRMAGHGLGAHLGVPMP
jgi:hypothetical protein